MRQTSLADAWLVWLHHHHRYVERPLVFLCLPVKQKERKKEREREGERRRGISGRKDEEKDCKGKKVKMFENCFQLTDE